MADDKSKKDMRRDNAVGDDSEARHFAERNGISIGQARDFIPPVRQRSQVARPRGGEA